MYMIKITIKRPFYKNIYTNYIKENLGRLFIIIFQLFLMLSISFRAFGYTLLADRLATFGYLSIFIGVVMTMRYIIAPLNRNYSLIRVTNETMNHLTQLFQEKKTELNEDDLDFDNFMIHLFQEALDAYLKRDYM